MKTNILNLEEFIVFTTREYANYVQTSLSSASKQLARLLDSKLITRLTRGIWANPAHPYFNPIFCVPKLLGNEQGYVSFLTALHRYGMVSQIPASIQVATTGHTRKLTTPVGQYEFFQIKPDLCRDGIMWSETRIPYLTATMEKALLDTFYIATRKSRRFAGLPELELVSTGFKKKRFIELLKNADIPKQVTNAIRVRFESLEWR